MKCTRIHKRQGSVTVLLAVMLPLLLGFGALAIDIGYIAYMRTRLQSGADAAALACREALPCDSNTLADIANRYTRLNAAQNSDFDISIELGYYNHVANTFDLSSLGYEAVRVTITQQDAGLFFGAFLGSENTDIVVSATAAGCGTEEQQGEQIGSIALDPRATPGTRFVGQGELSSDGTIIINSGGSGYDENGDWIDHGLGGYGVVTSGQGSIYTDHLLVYGGVSSLADIYSYTPGEPFPLDADYEILPDPLRDLPIPGADVPDGTHGVDLTLRENIKATGKKTYNLQPGIYGSITINGGYVTFQPGVYIITEQLKITGARSVSGIGVMFYLSGDNFVSDEGYGYYDALDGPLDLIPGTDLIPPPDPGEADVSYSNAVFTVTNSDFLLEPARDPTGENPYSSILFFQRRRNMNDVKMTGGGGEDIHMYGVYYGKWAEFRMAGGATFEGSFVVGTMNLAGQSTVEIRLGQDSVTMPTESCPLKIRLVM
jgi:hypothetical protein